MQRYVGRTTAVIVIAVLLSGHPARQPTQLVLTKAKNLNLHRRDESEAVQSFAGGGVVFSIVGEYATRWQKDGTFKKLGKLDNFEPRVRAIDKHDRTMTIYRFTNGIIIQVEEVDPFVLFGPSITDWMSREGIFVIKPQRAPKPGARFEVKINSTTLFAPYLTVMLTSCQP